MSKYRRGRINDAVAEELAIKMRDICDPRIVNNFVSITRAEVSPDLKIAKIYYSSMGDSNEAGKALVGMEGLLRRHLAQTLNLRITPELVFHADNSIEHGAHISKLLHDIETERKNRADSEKSDAENTDRDEDSAEKEEADRENRRNE